MKIAKILDVKLPFKGWLEEWYPNHYAQISVDTTLKLKSAIKDVCRVLEGRVLPEIEQITKKLPTPPQGIPDDKFIFGYEDSGVIIKGILETDPNLQEYVLKFPKHWEIVRQALALARNKGRHASAFVIADCPIPELGIPLTKISDVTCTAFTALGVEAMGGIKSDFLVINSLNDMSEALKLIQQRHRMPPAEGMYLNNIWVAPNQLVPHPVTQEFMDIWSLEEDGAVYSDIVHGRTETVFQINTELAVGWLKQFAYRVKNGRWAISSIKDLAIFTALDRPGPLDALVLSGSDSGNKHNMLVEYARRIRGAEPSPEIFGFMTTLFPETQGILIFQEQVQYAYQWITGCSGAEAEAFRRDVGKKKAEKIIKQYAKFIENGSTKLGSKENAEKAWEMIKTFANYGFPKAHATGYALNAYACAYFKHHYNLEWWCAVLKNATKNDVNEKFWRYCGHLLLLPEVAKSTPNYEIVGDKIQAPLSLLHGIGEKAHEQLVAGWPYTSIQDFCDKIEAFKEAGATTKNEIKIVTKKNKKTGEVTQIPKEVVKKTKRRSALGRGICYTLIISGSMDSLFPESFTTLDMLMAFEEALSKSQNIKKVEQIPDQYRDVNQLTRLQLRKSILPAYSVNILPMLIERQIENIRPGAQYTLYITSKGRFPFASAEDLETMEALNPWPDEETMKVAVAAYVETTRFFNWGPHKENEALEMILDIDGARKKFVRWGDRKTGKLPEKYQKPLDGAIVVGLLSKYRADKPFGIDDLDIIAEPFKKEKEKENDE